MGAREHGLASEGGRKLVLTDQVRDGTGPMRIIQTMLATTMLLGLGACGEEHGHGDEVPAPYAGKTNPMSGDPAALAEGAELYANNCANCHGDSGHGDGELALELQPPPTNFHTHTFGHEDDYLLWRISEGGAGDPVASDMPAWKNLWSEDQIWRVITHMREMHEL